MSPGKDIDNCVSSVTEIASSTAGRAARQCGSSILLFGFSDRKMPAAPDRTAFKRGRKCKRVTGSAMERTLPLEECPLLPPPSS